MEGTFCRDMAALQSVLDFIETCLTAHHADQASALAVTLAVEELFTNVVRHARGGQHDIIITVTKQDNTIFVAMSDTDVEPFDITRTVEVDTSLPLNSRQVGGLGIHLVKHLVDGLTYSYAGRRSTITFSKTLET